MIKMTPMNDVRQADAQAYELSQTMTAHQQIEWLLQAIGVRYIAASLGLTEARAVRAWETGESEPTPIQQHRLRILFRMAWMITAIWGDSRVAQRFLRCGCGPLAILARNNPTDVEDFLIHNLRNFAIGN